MLKNPLGAILPQNGYSDARHGPLVNPYPPPVAPVIPVIPHVVPPVVGESYIARKGQEVLSLTNENNKGLYDDYHHNEPHKGNYEIYTPYNYGKDYSSVEQNLPSQNYNPIQHDYYSHHLPESSPGHRINDSILANKNKGVIKDTIEYVDFTHNNPTTSVVAPQQNNQPIFGAAKPQDQNNYRIVYEHNHQQPNNPPHGDIIYKEVVHQVQGDNGFDHRRIDKFNNQSPESQGNIHAFDLTPVNDKHPNNDNIKQSLLQRLQQNIGHNTADAHIPELQNNHDHFLQHTTEKIFYGIKTVPETSRQELNHQVHLSSSDNQHHALTPNNEALPFTHIQQTHQLVKNSQGQNVHQVQTSEQFPQSYPSHKRLQTHLVHQNSGSNKNNFDIKTSNTRTNIQPRPNIPAAVNKLNFQQTLLNQNQQNKLNQNVGLNINNNNEGNPQESKEVSLSAFKNIIDKTLEKLKTRANSKLLSVNNNQDQNNHQNRVFHGPNMHLNINPTHQDPSSSYNPHSLLRNQYSNDYNKVEKRKMADSGEKTSQLNLFIDNLKHNEKDDSKLQKSNSHLFSDVEPKPMKHLFIPNQNHKMDYQSGHQHAKKKLELFKNETIENNLNKLIKYIGNHTSKSKDETIKLLTEQIKVWKEKQATRKIEQDYNANISSKQGGGLRPNPLVVNVPATPFQKDEATIDLMDIQLWAYLQHLNNLPDLTKIDGLLDEINDLQEVIKNNSIQAVEIPNRVPARKGTKRQRKRNKKNKRKRNKNRYESTEKEETDTTTKPNDTQDGDNKPNPTATSQRPAANFPARPVFNVQQMPKPVIKTTNLKTPQQLKQLEIIKSLLPKLKVLPMVVNKTADRGSITFITGKNGDSKIKSEAENINPSYRNMDGLIPNDPSHVTSSNPIITSRSSGISVLSAEPKRRKKKKNGRKRKHRKRRPRSFEKVEDTELELKTEEDNQ